MTSQDTRIYGENTNINKNKVKLFWNKRAEKYTEGNPYNAVKCNDNNKEYANKLDQYEKDVIIPRLNINKNSKVLDIGCGIGRLSEIIIPISKYYLGADFAEDLLTIAKNRIICDGNFDFEVCDFINISDNKTVQNNGLFDKVILAGVGMYINDEELISCFEKILEIIDKKATIYISNPIALKDRLTLEQFYSKELKSKYSVIYRTIDEYMDIFNVFTTHGFEILESKNFLREIKQYEETARHYFILTRS